MLRTLLGATAQRDPAHAAAVLEALPAVPRWVHLLLCLGGRQADAARQLGRRQKQGVTEERDVPEGLPLASVDQPQQTKHPVLRQLHGRHMLFFIPS